MSPAEIKDELHRLIDTLDERFLRAVHAMVSAYEAEEDQIVGYRIPGGEPIYLSKLGEELDAIVEEVENGDYITLEDLTREAEEW